jgi:GT2 family glycosyltransferase
VIGNTLHPKEFLMYVEDVELCFRIWSRGYYVKLESILYQPIIEIIHFPRYLMHKNNYNFAGAYYPSITMTYLKYSMKKLSTLNDYGNHIPLSIKFKNSKKFLFNPLKLIRSHLIKFDYEKMLITNDDIMKSKRKFIIIK